MNRKARIVIIASALLQINIAVFFSILQYKVKNMTELEMTVGLIITGLLIVGSILALIFVHSKRKSHSKRN